MLRGYSFGFHIDGLHKFSTFGQSNCGGDINGDGINDIIICSAGFTSQIRENSGACTIIFGSKEILKSVHNSKFDIINMDTSVGFHVLGLEGDYLGASYGCDRIGDINGDGIDDVVFSSMLSNHEGNGRLYILYGRSTQEWQDSLFMLRLTLFGIKYRVLSHTR